MAKRRPKRPDSGELASVHAAAFLNRVAPSDIERWLAEGRLRPHLVRGHVFVDLEELDRFLRGQEPTCGCAGTGWKLRRE